MSIRPEDIFNSLDVVAKLQHRRLLPDDSKKIHAGTAESPKIQRTLARHVVIAPVAFSLKEGEPNSAKQCWLLKKHVLGYLLPQTLTRGSLSMMPDRDDVMCGWRLGPQQETVRERDILSLRRLIWVSLLFFFMDDFYIYIHRILRRLVCPAMP